MELEEWRERYEWRHNKLEIANNSGLYSYMDRIIKQYDAAGNEKNLILSQNLPKFISLTWNGDLNLHSESREINHIWSFKVLLLFF